MYGVNVAACHIDVRMGFIRKVFGIVAAQLICTILVTAFVMSNPGLKLILQQSNKFSFFSFLATMGTLVALLANRKKSPLNMQLLAAFTVLESIAVATVVSFYDQTIVLQAAMICATVTVGLTIFTFQTKRDFTPLASSLVTGLWVLIGLGFVQAFVPFSKKQDLMVACGGAALFSMFLVVDIQIMLKKMSTDEYILCAINLYLDIINLFLEILRALNSRN